LAEAALGRGLALPRLRDGAVEWLAAHADLTVLGALMLVAGVLRFWGLGEMALHHDESLHARYSWLLYDGQGYQHNPLMHGPFLFHSGAAVFFLFGDSDATARFLPALFGTVLVGMPYLLRRQIGMPAVIIAAVLLTFSPTLLYFSRFYRNELYMAVWTLGIAICIWRYLDEQKPGWLYAMAALLAFSFASKEVTFITAAITLLFLNCMVATELGKRRDGEDVSRQIVMLRTLALAPVAWLIVAVWPLIGGRPFGRERLPPVGDVLLVFGTLSLPQFAAGVQILPFVGDSGYEVPAENTLKALTVLSLLALSTYAGLLWRPRAWLIAAAAFYVPYVLLYTTFFTNPDGFFGGTWNSLDYWLDQHHVQRGNQPGYYYALMTPLYEFLPLLAALGGAAWLALRGDSFRRWLLFWLAGIFTGLTLAGEKMPWLEMHIALPLIMVAAVALGGAVEALELRGRNLVQAVLMGVLSAACVLLIVDGDGIEDFLGAGVALALVAWLALVLAAEQTAGDARAASTGLRTGPSAGLRTGLTNALLAPELRLTVVAAAGVGMLLALASIAGLYGIEAIAVAWVVAIVPLAVLGYSLASILRTRRAFGRGLLAVVVAALLALTARAAITASFDHNDTPVEMLVYTQTSPDIPRLMDRIEALGAKSGLGYNLPIVVDNQDSFAWPWAWYLRDYHAVSFVNMTAAYTPPENAVLLINRSNTQLVDQQAYSASPYKHRWWFIESYRDLTLASATEQVTDLDSLEMLGRFFLYRRPVTGNTGSVDGVAYFPETLAAFDADPGPQAPARMPQRLTDGRLVLGLGNGSAGSAPGEFSQPADLFASPDGTLWVADTANNRIQQFDANGIFLNSAGRVGTLKEPWSLAVDSDGFVYVNDTWNFRVQKLSARLEPVLTWGRGGAGPQVGPLELFGPRDIAIAPDGTLWLTDTGNKRLLQFSKDGEPLGTFGSEGSGPGQFIEPVGLAFDAAGNLYVADTWNGRVQRFSPGFVFSGSFPVEWSSQDVLAKPYLTVLKDSKLLVTVPEAGQLVLFDANGQRQGTWKPSADSYPVGVTAMADGGFAFSDTRRHEVQIVPAGLLGNVFR
jgi:predicted membrane-bound mannosyltransferase/sugar lactone lactonase YvrE